MHTPETFPRDADTVARMLGHDGLELIADGERGPIFTCTGDCATLWWPDPYTYLGQADGREVLIVHADRYISGNGGEHCAECQRIPSVVTVDASTLSPVGSE